MAMAKKRQNYKQLLITEEVRQQMGENLAFSDAASQAACVARLTVSRNNNAHTVSRASLDMVIRELAERRPTVPLEVVSTATKKKRKNKRKKVPAAAAASERPKKKAKKAPAEPVL